MRKMNVSPLSSSFMLTSMVGFLVSAFFVYGLSKTWGFTMVSMTYAPVDFDHSRRKKK